MKNKKIIILIIVFFSTLIYILKFKCYRSLPEINNYKIVSDLGKKIPAKLYTRNINYKINGRQHNLKEIIICFDDSIITNDSKYINKEILSKFLIVIPDKKMIGLVNDPSSFKMKSNCICQTDEIADTFTSIINNHSYFSNPPIKKAVFTKNKIIFNSYGILKKYGENIIIEIYEN